MQPSNNQQQWQPPVPSEIDTFVTTPTVAAAPIVSMQPDGQSASAPWVPPEAPSSAVQDQPPQIEQPIDDSLVHWQGVEYIHRQKGAGWYAIFTLVIIALMSVAIFLIKEWTFAILTPVMAVALVVYSRRLPRMIDYTLSRQGLHINDRLYPFGDFNGFGVIHDEEEYSVVLIPTKRFKPGVSVYFPEESGEAIVDMLGARLPMQDLHSDLVDRLIRTLRI